jgi:hypothetical protein
MDPRKMACDFIDASRESFELRRWRGTWFEFVSGRGWREIAEDEIEARVLTFLAAHSEHAQHARLNAVKEILAQLGTFTLGGLPESIEMPARLIRDASGAWSGEPCPNVVALRVNGKLVTMDLIEVAKHIAQLRQELPGLGSADSSFFSLDWMPYGVESGHLTPAGVDLAREAPLFSKYIEHALDPAEQEAARRMLGLCIARYLAGASRTRRCCRLCGYRDAGGSVLLLAASTRQGQSNRRLEHGRTRQSCQVGGVIQEPRERGGV